MTLIVDGTTGVTFNDSSLQGAAASPFGLKNRIINGDMRIAQRTTSAVTTDDSYPVDRINIAYNTDGAFSAQQSSTAPTGFTNSLLWTTTTADSSLSSTQRALIMHNIEGFNTADLGWGTADAKTVTLSFWVRSSLTGTFGGSLANNAQNRSYPFTYSISSANTWEQKSVTIAGDTTGTWVTNNGVGLRIRFSMGVGSSYLGTAGAWVGADHRGATGEINVMGTLNATFYITGVQLEIGTSATPFERRLYGQELALCQRYYYRATGTGRLNMGLSINTTNADGSLPFPTTMRTAPTALEQSGTASHYSVYTAAAANSCTSVPVFVEANINSGFYRLPTGAAQTTGQSVLMGINNASGYLGWSAEL